MAPKIKVTKEQIIKTALALCIQNGDSAINARSIASALGCSTQPVFSNFENMQVLLKSVKAAAHNMYLEFLKNEAESGNYPKYKAFGMAYIKFAKEQRELFRLLFMCDRKGENNASTVDFEQSVDMIMSANGISRQKAELIHFEMWAFVHGIAVMIATSFYSFEWDQISDMLTDVYQGLKSRHITEEKQ